MIDLTERINAMESNQVALNEQLKLVEAERDQLRKEKLALQEQLEAANQRIKQYEEQERLSRERKARAFILQN